MSDEQTWYDFAVLRAVPHVHLGAFVPVGVLVHARQAGYLDEISGWRFGALPLRP